MNAVLDSPEPVPGVARQDYLEAMARAVAGVSVVSTDGHAGRAGLTVSAMTSVSADPPLLLVCIHGQSPVEAVLRENRVFCVNLLGSQQQRVAEVFAGLHREHFTSRFDCARWRILATGAPVLEGAVAAFDCELHEQTLMGSHRVLFGRVLATVQQPGEPLLYTGRRFGEPRIFHR